MIFIRAFVSWFPALGLGGGSIYSFLTKLTDPVLNPIRKLLYRIDAMRNLPVDISPIVAYFALALIARIIAII